MPKTTTNRSYNNSPHFIISSNLNIKYTISIKQKTLSCQRKMYYNNMIKNLNFYM